MIIELSFKMAGAFMVLFFVFLGVDSAVALPEEHIIEWFLILAIPVFLWLEFYIEYHVTITKDTDTWLYGHE